MKQQTIIQTPKQTMSPQTRGLFPHATVHATSDHDLFSNSSTESRFRHDFSQVVVHPSVSVIGQNYSNPSSPPRIQAKLKIGQPGDKYEQEADRVAEQVMRMPDPRLSSSVGNSSLASSGNSSSGAIQRVCAPCSAEYQVAKNKNHFVEPSNLCPKCRTEGEEWVQMKTMRHGVPDVTPGISTNIRSLQGAGRPMSGSERDFFEPRFGADFSGVRVHDDTRAAGVARSVGARAFTLGRDVVFGAGEYSPNSSSGKKLFAHELVHVGQQNTWPSYPGNGLIQRSCFDGDCDNCATGWKNLWMTVFFARRANAATMTTLRARITKAKTILENCCVRLKFDFNWTLIPGAAAVETASRHRRPAGDPLGTFDVPEPQETIGEGDLVAGARGIPLLIVDEVRGTGGATTMLGGQDDAGRDYDVEYTGSSMFIMAVNQPNEGACSAVDSTIAHELWHIAGALRHNAADGAITDCSGEGVAEPYCVAVRDLA